jgi:hypothetical protein
MTQRKGGKAVAKGQDLVPKVDEYAGDKGLADLVQTLPQQGEVLEVTEADVARRLHLQAYHPAVGRLSHDVHLRSVGGSEVVKGGRRG